MLVNDHLIFILIPTVSQTLLDVGCIAMDETLTVPSLCGAYILGGWVVYRFANCSEHFKAKAQSCERVELEIPNLRLGRSVRS